MAEEGGGFFPGDGEGEMSGFPEYGKSRFPKAQPKGICRGCRGPITDKRRQTWCSRECQEKFHPWHVKRAVAKRSGEKCEMCGRDCSRGANSIHRQSRPKSPTYEECGLQYPYDSKAHYSSPLYRQYVQAYREWKNAAPKPEYDHIVPHSEGGLFTVDNIRLLCRACHLKRTKLWHAERKKSKQQYSPLTHGSGL